MTRRDLASAGVIVVVFAVAVLAVDPRGNFPLDDDWDFSLSTWSLVQNGVIQHTPFTSATGVLQYFWGALWTIAFGASSTVLRASTLALSLLATILVYAILRRLDVRSGLALFAALSFLSHPLILWASFTYMTHVPELFLSVAAFALLVEALRRQSNAWIAFAAIVAAASVLVRQIGIVNALAPLIAAVAFRAEIGPRWKTMAAWYGGAVALFAGLMASGTLIMSTQEAAIHMQRPAQLLIAAAHYGMFNVQYAALFFLPLVVLALAIRPSWCALTLFGVWFALIAAHMLVLRRPIPYPARGNVFVNFALGPPTLRDTFVFRLPYPFHVSDAALTALMIVSTAAAIFLAAFLARRKSSLVERIGAIYCLCGTLILMFMHIYFDRYSIDTMWPVAIVIPLAVRERTITRAVAAIVLAIVFAFAVSGTAEYLAWNRARWAAYHWLESRGVTLAQMDGGYEINAMLAIQRGQKDLGKAGFGVVDDRFILAFQDVRGYAPIARFPYRRLLGPDGAVLVLQRATR